MAWCIGFVLLSLFLLSVDVSWQQTLSLTVRNETNGLVPAIYADQDYHVSRYTETCLLVKPRNKCPSPKKTVVRINGGIRDDYCLLPGCNESIVLTAVLTYHQEANLSLTVTISDNGSKLEAEFSCPGGFKPYLNGTILDNSTLVFNNASLISRASAWVPEGNDVWRYRVRAYCGEEQLSLTVRNESNGLVPAIFANSSQNYNVSSYTENCLLLASRDNCPSPSKPVIRINGGTMEDYCTRARCNETIVLTAEFTYNKKAILSLTVTISDNGNKLEAEFSCPAGFKPILNGARVENNTLVFNSASFISGASGWVQSSGNVWSCRVTAKCGEVEPTFRQPSTESSSDQNTTLTSSGPTNISQHENLPHGGPLSESQLIIYISGSAAGLVLLILGAVILFLLIRRRNRKKASVQNEFALRVNTPRPEADGSRESAGQYSTVGLALNAMSHMTNASSDADHSTSRTGDQQIHDAILSAEVTDTYAQVIKPNIKLNPSQDAPAFANPTYGSRKSMMDTVNATTQGDPNSETYANVPSLMRSDSYTNSEQGEITSPSMIRLVENDLYGTSIEAVLTTS